MYDSCPDPKLSERPGFRLYRLSQTVRASYATHLAPLGLGPVEAWILMLMRDGAARQPGELAKALGMDPGGVTRMIKRMAASGLVRRSRRGDDLRSVHLEMAPKAQDLTLKIAAAVERAEREFVEGMAFQDAALLDRLLSERLERTARP